MEGTGMNGKFAKWGLSQILAIVMLVMAGSAFAAGEALVHNSDNLGTKYGTWGVAGGKYGQFICTTCHNKTTNNVKRVAGTITAPLGSWSSSQTPTVSVVFNNMTAFGNDAGGHTTSTHICEVCHSKTSVHKYNTTGQTDLDHQGSNNTDCTSCHSHANAFKAQGCNTCHGDATTLITGKHAAHVNNDSTLGLSYGCVDCHAKSVTSNTAIKPAPTAHRNGIYGDFSAARAYETGYVQGSGNCSTYCHTNGKGGAAAVSVNWISGPAINDCKGCHGGGGSAGEPSYPNGGAAAVDANSHPKHVAATGGAASCQNCHGATMSGASLNASGKHTDKTIDVLQGNSKTFGYTDASKTCSTSSCHSNGFFTAADAQWGATLDCKGCHGDATNAATKLSGAHNAHINGGAATGGMFGCVDCHATTVTNNTTLKASGTHMNNLLNFTSAKAYKTGFNLAAGTCSTYCHTNGRGQAPAVAVTWTGAAIDCGGCHGKDSVSITSGSHQKHLSDSATCANCHSLTTTDNVSVTGANHIDGTVELQQGGANFNGKPVQFSYAGSLTCNNISCHSAYASPVNTAVWGTPATCNTCHPQGSLSGAHAVHMGALNLASGSVYYNMTANRSPSQDESVGRTYGFGCGTCHPMNPANHLNGSIDVDLNRVNPFLPVGTLRFLNHSTAGYTMGSTKVCSNIYCHSNASRVEAESNVASNTSLAWTDTFAAHPANDRCAYCHGNQPTTGAHGAHAVSNHYDNVYNGKSGKVTTNKLLSGNNLAHGNPNNSTTINCYICHNEVVKTKRNDMNTKCIGCHNAANTVGASYGVKASIANLSLHVNGARNINLAPIQVLSRAQIRPKGPINQQATDQRSGFDFYSGIWQRTSYKSFSTLSYDKAKYALDTDTMWHPSTPMNSNCTNVACHNGKTVSWNLANWNDPNKCMDCHNAL